MVTVKKLQSGQFKKMQNGLYLRRQGDMPTGMMKGIGVIPNGNVNADTTLLNTSWWYEWDNYSTHTPESTPGKQYVPMMWGDWENEQRYNIGGNPAASIGTSSILLGFNEPDISDQSNVSVARALALWPQLEATGARLGSPAPTTPGTFTWLSSFMSGNGGGYIPKVDFVCVHWYADLPGGYTIGSFLDAVRAAYPTKPIWLTEVGNLSGGIAANASLIPTVMSALATRPWVERVAWFTARDNSGWTNTHLIEDNGTLNSAGSAYAGYPSIVLPGVPDAPTSLVATAGAGQVSLTWSAPASDGGSPVTDYIIEWRATS